MRAIGRFLLGIWFLGWAGMATAQPTAQDIFRKYKDAVCLVHYYQNVASNSRIGSFNKIEHFHNGIIVSDSGLVMVSSDVYPVSMDIVSENGSLLTGHPSDFRVKLTDGREFPAEFVGKDDQAQVAFIRIQADTVFPYVRFRSGTPLQIGDTIYLLERLPKRYNFGSVFTPLVVHAVVDFPRLKYLVKETSVVLSACGLVINARGEAVGITIQSQPHFRFRTPEDFEEFRTSFLEIAPAEWFVDLIQNPPRVRENQAPQKPWLGIRMQGLTPELREYWQVPAEGGVVVNRVYPNSPAEKAGLQEGDVILAVNHQPLRVQKDEETAQMREMIHTLPPGSAVELKIFRSGKILHKKVMLEPAPLAIGVAPKLTVPEVGVELRALTRDILHQENLPLNFPGVYVYQVDRASPAGIAGLHIGDIIQKIDDTEISDLSTARKFFQNPRNRAKTRFVVQIWRDRETRFIFIDLNR